MLIVCGCEGQLYLMDGDRTLVCGVCRKTYSAVEVEKILKCLALADYRPKAAGQQGPTEPEIRAALRRAAIKAARLELRLVDADVMRVPVAPRQATPPPRPPQPAPSVGWVTNTTTSAGNVVNGAVFVRGIGWIVYG